ncbi:unnamed protein product, partial [Mesorhabditis belari]|uniref:Hydroxylysine kinase n=1 Tax=Mesorhabditis belari TaxID=2138241 RepID=A0AAF3EY93_9BILA
MFTQDEVTQAPRIPIEKVKRILKNAWGIVSCDVQVLNGYEDMNFRATRCVWDHGMSEDETVIFKITNPVAARNTRHLDFQRHVCETLTSNGIPAPYYIPLKNSQKIWRLEKITDNVVLPVRLIRILPGTNLEHFPFDQNTVIRIGRLVGDFHNVMDMIPKAQWHQHIPFIAAENVDCAVKEVEILQKAGFLTPQKSMLVRKVFAELREMLNESHNMDTGLIHSDINDTNILVEQKEEQLEITGLIDMGDVHCSLRIMDIGATCLYLALGDSSDDKDWSRFPRWFLEGYESVRECADAAKIISGMRARMACSLICGLRAARINYRKEHDAYVLKTQIRGWNMLEQLSRAGAHPLI